MSTHQRFLTGFLSAILIFAVLANLGIAKRKNPPGPAVSYGIKLLPAAMETADAMNTSGDIVGGQFLYPATATSDDDLVDVAVLISAELLASGLLEGQVVETRIADVNNGLQIVGTYVDEVRDEGVLVARTGYAFVGTLNTALDGFTNFIHLPNMITIDLIPYTCGLSPEAINLSGHVTGTAFVGDIGEYGEHHAFVWTGDPAEVIDLIPDTMPGVYDSRAVDINDAGQILAQFRVEDEVRAVRMTLSGEYTELGDLRKRPKNHPVAMNRHGEATGACQGPYYYDRAYFYSDDGGIDNLGTLYNSRYSVSTASSINSEGHIVGRSGEFHDWTDPRSGGYLYTGSLGMVNLATLIANPPEGMVSQSLAPNCIIDPEEWEQYGRIAGKVDVVNGSGELTYRAFLLTPAD